MRSHQKSRAPPRRRLLAPGLAILLGILVPGGAARADIPQTQDGPGIKVGQRSTLHPGFALILGADSNVFWTNPQDRGGVRASAYTMPTVWLGLGNRKVRDSVLQAPPGPSDRKVDYNVRVSAGYRAYLAADPDIRKQSRFNFTIDGHLVFAPGRRFSVAVDENFARLAEPRNYVAGPDFNYNRIDHNGALTFTLRPGGGRLSASASYLNEVLYYEASDVFNADRVVNGAAADVRWRFLPKSALVARYTFHYTYYLCCVETGTGRNEDSRAHRVVGGYRGIIGQRLFLEALLGYGKADYIYDTTTPANFKGFIGSTSLSYYPTLRTNISIQLERAFHDSLFGNYFKDVGGRIGAAHTFRWRMFAALQLAVIGRRYEGLPVPGQDIDTITGYDNVYGDFGASVARKDTIFSLESRVEQPLGKLFVLALRYNLSVVRSDFVARYANGFVDYAAFSKHVVMLIGAVRF
ncbi:MAG: hypothetical protein H6710_22180 [Myxococcales bacterium]|nr:hypothetical protein [Myxococcales bacterium]MCB9704047.1 hypothetical protein [Myxococcales bacterium]